MLLWFCPCESETCSFPGACKGDVGCAPSQGGRWDLVVPSRFSQHHLGTPLQGIILGTPLPQHHLRVLHHWSITVGTPSLGHHHQDDPSLPLVLSCAKSLCWSLCRSTAAAQSVAGKEKGFARKLQPAAGHRVTSGPHAGYHQSFCPRSVTGHSCHESSDCPLPRAAKSHTAILLKDG